MVQCLFTQELHQKLPGLWSNICLGIPNCFTYFGKGPALCCSRLRWDTGSVLVLVLVARVPIRLPANAPRKSANDVASPGVPASYTGNLLGVPGSWIQSGQIFTFRIESEDRSFTLSSSHTHSGFQVHKQWTDLLGKKVNIYMLGEINKIYNYQSFGDLIQSHH